eukprot:CAMPEP_0178929318 /NCGR_PEP_ID=MMETSP0786-20121207/20504_1 /TAXON_ID=186022 /ORGANISM="Thalassionema frauenfeldii, Strain CCMP 1798" /LENGTH=639 /DNA_ID=CAMNT_0020605503 /DNA_START=58 /DNA_END=1977 /DNA_ORIENTATION=-
MRFRQILPSASSFMACYAAIGAMHGDTSQVYAKTVEYTWRLIPRRAQKKDPSLSPDCNLNRHMLLVNDQLPGPALEADVGDTVKLTFINESPSEGAALHFHGLDMLGYPYADGSSSVAQCALGPKQTQVYEFIALDAGTHYWHGHLSMDRADGFQGPIIISDPKSKYEKELKAMYDDEAVVFLQDWYHMSGPERRTGLDTDPFIWIGNAQSFLINGGGVYSSCLSGGDFCADNCSPDNYIKSLDVVSGKTYRLRIISGTELIGVNFAITGHKLTVVEVEGAIVEPFEVSSLDIMPAQRYSVLVTADQTPGSYWATTAVRYRSTAPRGYLVMNYVDAPSTPLSLEGPFPEQPAWDDVEPSIDLENQLLTKNIDDYDDADILNADPKSIRRMIMVGTQARDLVTNQLRWAMNNVSQTFPSEPLIYSAYKAVQSSDSSWPDVEIPGTVVVPDHPPTPWNYTEPVQDSVGIYNGARGPAVVHISEGEVIELILQNARALNGVPEMHSWHTHGFKFYVVGFGFGTFDETTDQESYNLVNPVRRDTVSLLPLGWTAIRFRVNNPGVWPFHCTQPSHSMMGMGFQFVTSPDKLSPPPPGAYNCLLTSLDPADAGQCLDDGGDGKDHMKGKKTKKGKKGKKRKLRRG